MDTELTIGASFTFLSPLAAAVAALVFIALLVLYFAERRSRRITKALGLPAPGPLAPVPNALALLAIAALIALAAAQPVVSSVAPRDGRTDAEVIFVFDVTRSMLAARSRTSPTRFERTRDAAKLMRSEFADVPVGISTLTDRVLPHLFPSVSSNAFTSTVDRAIGIERPPPDRRAMTTTGFVSLAVLANQNFFGEKSKRRAIVVFTDGESLAFDAFQLDAVLSKAKITPFFIQFWAPDDRVYRNGKIERGYRPEPGTPERLRTIADALGGRAFSEEQLEEAIAAVRKNLGTGPMGAHGEELQSRSLAPHALAFAFFPLLFILWRRNL